MIDYFPSKLALGEQFCNRIREKDFLKTNIGKGRHTVIIAPRRYGKSSLVIKVVAELALPFASIDLFLAHDDAAVTKRILVGIGEAVSQIMPLDQKVLVKLQSLFSQFRVSLNAQGFNIDAAFDQSRLDPVDQIFSGLEALSKLALAQEKNILFFMDEFQDIKEAASAKSIQGAIRHIAQETSNITFIFSGSNRRLLLELFDNKSKPLYMLCDMLILERMSSEDYWTHLQKLAQKKWGEALPDRIFNKIIALTELHPYYVNLLCNEVWKLNAIPSLDAIFDCWQRGYEVHEDRLIADLDKLTAKQQDILKALALNPVIEPTGQGFVRASKTAASSIAQTIKLLMYNDMVYKIKKVDPRTPQIELNQLRVLDPLLAYALRKYE